MRIIAGALKGRRLEAPTWEGLRPTSDKLRETLFNVLQDRTPGANVLDGFAGTGAVGIEALSRGASEVTFVESDPRAARLVERNLGRCGVDDRYVIIRARLAEAVRRLPAGTFDLVLLDPPYGADSLHAALQEGAGLVASDGLLVIEHARRNAASATADALTKIREIVSGDSALSIFRPHGESAV
jgi:16S rRNA (guanine(966)-N(2))-methyltransferase RsmD